MARVAAYIRVSRADLSVENQRPEVEQLARQRGEIVAVFEEQASAVKHRPQFEAMLTAAKRGQFDVLVVWAIDRFGRSMIGNLQDLLELDRIGVEVVSVREPWLTTAGPTRPLLIAVFSWVAEQERNRLIERTKAGIERARRSGKHIGRRRRYVDVERAQTLLAEGLAQRAVAARLGVGKGTLQRALAKAG